MRTKRRNQSWISYWVHLRRMQRHLLKRFNLSHKKPTYDTSRIQVSGLQWGLQILEIMGPTQEKHPRRWWQLQMRRMRKSLQVFGVLLWPRYGHPREKSNYICDICGKCFAGHHAMVRHRITNHTKDFRYKCTKCDRGFIGRAQCEIHERSHGEWHICNQCDKIFKNRICFKRHLATHEPDYVPKEYVCEICSKVYPQSGALYNHMKRNHERKKYVCEICDKALSSSVSLIHHRRTHSGEKPYVCDTCGRAFAVKQRLAIHVLTHTEEKRFKCEVCGKAFTQKAKFTIHFRKHTGEKPYQCTFCMKGFISSTLLRYHLKKHEL